MSDIIIFTDGSTLNNQNKGKRKGGVGVFFGKNDERNISMPLKETSSNKVTNQVTELLACVMALETLLSSQIVKSKKIIIYTDSIYIVNMMSDWIKKWVKNDWKKSDGKLVDNIELIKKLYFYSMNIGVKFKHVRSHQKEPSKDSSDYNIWFGNDQADKLAVVASKSL